MKEIKEKFPFVECRHCGDCVLRIKKDAEWNDVVTCDNAEDCVATYIEEMEKK